MGFGSLGHVETPPNTPIRTLDPFHGKPLRFCGFIDFAVKSHVGPLQKRYTGGRF